MFGSRSRMVLNDANQLGGPILKALLVGVLAEDDDA